MLIWGLVAVSDVPAKEEGSPPKNKKTKSRKAECDIDFTKALDTDLSHIFDPPKNPKSLLLPVNRAPSNRLLPEDCHYQPEDLVKLFLLPNVMVCNLELIICSSFKCTMHHLMICVLIL